MIIRYIGNRQFQKRCFSHLMRRKGSAIWLRAINGGRFSHLHRKPWRQGPSLPRQRSTPNAEDETVSVSLDAEHVSSAERLLTSSFSHLPQQHMNPDLRSRMLRTAILCQLRDAQVASILNPAKDKNGRTAQVILPYLHQQFPHDEAVEILRFNFRPVFGGGKGGGDPLGVGADDEDDMDIDSEVPVEKPADGFTFDRPFQVTSTASVTQTTTASEPVVARTAPPAPAIAAEIQPSPFLPQPVVSPLPATVPLKRKSEEARISKLSAAEQKKVRLCLQIVWAYHSFHATVSRLLTATANARCASLRARW